MTDAFQCDRCEKFGTAAPARFAIREYGDVPICGWTDGVSKRKLELCSECAESLESTLDKWQNEDGG